MADIRLRRHEGHRHLIANTRITKGCVEDKGEFIGRAVTGGALNRADDDWPGRLDELVEGGFRLYRMIGLADGLSVSLGSESRHFVEGEVRSGCDDQIVVVQNVTTVKPYLVRGRLDAFRAFRAQIDASLLQHRDEIDGYILGCRQPTATQGLDGTNE